MSYILSKSNNRGEGMAALRKSKCFACNSKNRPLFMFPNSKEKAMMWLESLGVDRFLDYDFYYFRKNARLCAIHFDDTVFSSSAKNSLLRSSLLLPKRYFFSPESPQSDELYIEETTQQEPPASDTSNFQSHKNLTSAMPASEHKSDNITMSSSKSTKKSISDVRPLKSKTKIIKKRLNNQRSSLLKKLEDCLNKKLYDFVRSLLRNSLKQGKGRQWTKQEKCSVIEIYYQSFSAYKLIRKYLVLPSKSTIKRSLNFVNSSGFCPNLTSCLQQLVSEMKPKERFCTLTYEEIPIRKRVSYDFESDAFYGFEDYHTRHPASKALIFMVRGISKDWKQVLGYFFLSGNESNIDAKKLFLFKALKQAKSCGLTVLAVICNQGKEGSSNQALIKDLQVSTERPYFTFDEKKYFVLFDPPNLLKSVIDALQNYRIWFSFQKGTTISGLASWKHIRQLFEVDSKQEYRLCPKLTDAHVAVTSTEKKSTLAAQVLSYPVAAALHFYALSPVFEVETKAVQTAEFIGKLDEIFRSLSSPLYSRPGKQTPGGTVKDRFGHIEFWYDAIKFFESWTMMTDTGTAVRSSLQSGWVMTLKGLIGVWVCLRDRDFTSLRFNMDCLAGTVESIKRRKSFQRSPDCRQFSKMVHAEVVRDFMRKSPDKSGKAGDLLDFGKLNRTSLTAILGEDSDVEIDGYGGSPFPEEYFRKENFLLYVAGFVATEYCCWSGCEECKGLVTYARKVGKDTITLCLEEFDNGLNWPSEEFEKYMKSLNDSFVQYFDYHLVGVRKQVTDKLLDQKFDLFDNHVEHREIAQDFIVKTFANIMTNHKLHWYTNILDSYFYMEDL